MSEISKADSIGHREIRSTRESLHLPLSFSCSLLFFDCVSSFSFFTIHSVTLPFLSIVYTETEVRIRKYTLSIEPRSMKRSSLYSRGTWISPIYLCPVPQSSIIPLLFLSVCFFSNFDSGRVCLNSTRFNPVRGIQESFPFQWSLVVHIVRIALQRSDIDLSALYTECFFLFMLQSRKWRCTNVGILRWVSQTHIMFFTCSITTIFENHWQLRGSLILSFLWQLAFTRMTCLGWNL